MDNNDIDGHQYNTRSKGPVNNDGQKKNKKKGFKVVDTLPKNIITINKNTSNTIVNNDNTIKKYDISSDTKNDINMLIIKSLVDIANKKMKKKNYDKMILDHEDHSSDEDFTEENSDDEFEVKIGLNENVQYTEEERAYIKKMDKKQLNELVIKENQIYEALRADVPVRFKILNSNMKTRTIANILNRVDHFYTLDPTDNEYQKLYPWVEQLDKIPFNKIVPPIITDKDSPVKIQSYLSKTRQIMDDAIFGHDAAKTQILSILAREIANPESGGNSIAIQGPMGNGKTTLIKEGVCKAMNRPFAFIALGGMQDSSFLQGHEFTYEGSKCGRIIEMIIESNCMNPVIFFDELDKVSDTPKGEEITNLLCHITDSSQNKEFHDKYFSGIDFDLSKATFIFSYNDESKINPILLDRMYRIKTEGFDKKSKTKIACDYLLPKLLNEFSFNKDDIIFTEEAIHNLIDHHSNNEKGVRNLKRNLETIIAKLNIMRYLKPELVKLSVIKELDTDHNITKDTNQEDGKQVGEAQDQETQVVEQVEETQVVEQVEETQVVEQVEETQVVEQVDEQEENQILEKELTSDKDDDKIVTEDENIKLQVTTTVSEEPNVINDINRIINFKIKNFKIPYTVTEDDLSCFVKSNKTNPSLEFMYT